MRHGVCLDGMNLEQRELALGVLKASLSPSGFELARNIMRLNESIREITGSDAGGRSRREAHTRRFVEGNPLCPCRVEWLFGAAPEEGVRLHRGRLQGGAFRNDWWL